MILFLKLLFAHFLGDFLLQPKKWVDEKEKKKLKSPKLYYHIGIHTLLLFIVLSFDYNYFLGILFIALTHFCIDISKLYFQKKKSKGSWFFIDQFLHLFILIVVAFYYNSLDLNFIQTQINRLIPLALCVLFITTVSSVIVKTIINQWKPESKKETDDSLAKAGRLIGMLERLFVFVFVITNHWGAIGFLVTAKSVFRFGDLTSSKDRKLTEYVLIGTLLSFGLAILTGIVYSQLINIF